MKKILLRISSVFLMGMIVFTVSAQDVFEKMYQEQLANDKLGHALKDEANLKTVQIGIESACSIEKSAVNNKLNVQLSENEILVINAQGYPSSGYRWVLVSDNKSIVELVAQKAEPARDPGAPENERFVLKGLDRGITSLRFEYMRPWEDKAPLKEYEINVSCDGMYKGSFQFVEEQAEPAKVEVKDENPDKALPTSFDWRNNGGNFVTSVKDQGSSGACWAFGASGSFESVIKIKTGATRDLSEQWLCNCNEQGFSCQSGGWFPQYHWLPTYYGAVYESQLPFNGYDGTCNSYTYNENISAWGYTDGISDYAWPAQNHSATNTQIKQAIYDYGPVAANCYAGCWTSTTGIFTGNCTSGGHIVTIVGWNDTGGYWIIKNSWGTAWADGGYIKLAYNTCTMGTYSVWVTMNGSNPTDTQAPTIPTNLRSTGVTTNSVSLAWNASTDNVGVTSYSIYNSTTGVTISTSSTSYTVSGLTASTTYTFMVNAKDAAGNTSGWSTSVQATTSGSGTDDGGALSNGVTANGTMDSADGSDMWYIDVPAGATSMHVVLECGSADFDTYGKFNAQPTTSSYDWRGYTSGGEDNTVTNPQQGRHYIMVDYYSGSGSYTLRVDVSAGGDTQAPTVPSNFRSTAVASNSVSLAWNASTDNVGVTSYSVNNVTTGVTSTTSSTSNTVSGLSPNTSYTFRVNARDAAGNTSAWSSNVTATTTGGVVTTYCTPVVSSPLSYFFISNVTLGSINNNSTLASSSGYTDYTASVSTNLVKGSSYTLSEKFEPGWSGNSGAAWIDWNADGDFDDAGEQVLNRTSATSPYTATVTVPSTAVNRSTRMRVRLAYSATLTPCGNIYYGETEDYTINITSGTPAMGIDDAIVVSPNPCSDVLKVRIPESGAILQITTMDGRVEYSKVADELNSSIDMSSLSSGVYILSIITENDVVTKQIVKK